MVARRRALHPNAPSAFPLDKLRRWLGRARVPLLSSAAVLGLAPVPLSAPGTAEEAEATPPPMWRPALPEVLPATFGTHGLAAPYGPAGDTSVLEIPTVRGVDGREEAATPAMQEVLRQIEAREAAARTASGEQAADAVFAPSGDEFQVNTYTNSFQREPSVAMDAEGDFVVVWHSYGSAGTDTDGYSIQAQRYDASGTPQGSQFQVNTYTTSTQFSPSVAMDADGDFVVAWGSQGSSGTDTDNLSIHAQRYDASGTPQGSQFQVNTYTTSNQREPSVSMDADGDFVIAWRSYGSAGGDTDGYSIQAQRYDASGTPQGAQFQVNTYTTSGQHNPSVAMDADGDFVVVWDSYGSSGTDNPYSYSVQAQRYNADGTTAGTEFQVNTYTTSFQRRPSVAMDAEGDFVIAWASNGSSGSDTDNYSIQGQRYNSSGIAQGSEFQVNTYTTSFQNNPSVAMDAEGDFVVAWQSYGASGIDTDYYSIQAQRYDASGTPQGAQFQVNTYTTSGQHNPSMAMDADGDFVIAWESEGSAGTDTDGYSIQAQRYRTVASNDPGDQFQVNTYTIANQNNPSVAMDAEGDFVVAWQSYGASGIDTDYYSIQAQRYLADGTPQGSQFQVNTYTTLSQFAPSVAMDQGGDFVVAWASEGSAGTDTGGRSIQAQRYDANGTPQGTEFQVNTYTTSDQNIPSVAMDADGDFVVAWRSSGSYGSDTDSNSIQAQRYLADGTPDGTEFQVNTYTTFNQGAPSVAMDADGDFVIAWNSYGASGTDTHYYSIQAQRYDASGTPQGAQFQVNTYTTLDQAEPSVAMDADGDFVIAWNSYAASGTDASGYSIQAQRYDASGTPQGTEFQVNTYTTGDQVDPSVAMDADGDFVIAWKSQGSSGSDTSQYSIQAQRYDASGTPQGTEFQVNTYTTGGQELPSVAMDAGGDFVVAWTSNGSAGTDTGGISVQAQRYLRTARPSASLQPPTVAEDGGEFQVNTYTTSFQFDSSVAVDADGDFVVVWGSLGSSGTDTDGNSIQAQRYLSDGTPDGAQFQVNTYTTGDQVDPSVAMDQGGDFVVAWASEGSAGTDTGGRSIQAQRYDASGTPQGSQFQVNTYTTSDQNIPSVAMDADGDFVVAWRSSGSYGSDTDSNSIQGQRYLADGTPDGTEFQVNTYTTFNQVNPSVAMDADGDFVVVWYSTGSYGTDTSGYSIQAQRYNANGTTAGAEFQVNTYTTINQIAPSVALDADGDFVVAWQSYGSSGSDTAGYSVQAQRYFADGTPAGSEFQVNTYTTSFQRDPSVALDADGDFVVAWQSYGSSGSDTSAYSVQAQRYFADGTPAGAEFQVNTYTTGAQQLASVALDADGDFVVVWQSAGSSGSDTSGYSIQAQRYDATGLEAWHLLASPLQAATFDDLFGGFWTQGVPGSDAPAAEANLFRYDESTAGDQNQGWAAVSGQTDTMAPGRGYALYAFADDDNDGTDDGFPKPLSAEGTGNPIPFAFDGLNGRYDLSYTDTAAPTADGWNLAGNPVEQTLDWDAMVKANLDGTVYVWDPNLPAYRTWNGAAGDLTDGLIAAFQGFFVQATGDDPELGFESDAVTSGGTLYKRGASETPMLRLEVSDGQRRGAAFVMLSDEATPGKDRLDSYQLRPLASSYVAAYTRLPSGAGVVVNALPRDFDETISLPLEIEATAGGPLTLRVTQMAGMGDIWLNDAETGAKVRLTEGAAYDFEMTAVGKQDARAALLNGPRVLEAEQAAAKTTPRFTLEVEPATATGIDTAAEIPETLTLNQNYPNPFNPSTTIRYGLPTSSPVRLVVYDVLGREVARLVDGRQSAGWHTIQWAAGDRASGLYLYVLEAGGERRQGSMLLVK